METITTYSASDLVNAIQICADNVDQYKIQHSKRMVTAMKGIGQLVESHIGDLSRKLIGELEEKLKKCDKWGLPPSFIHVAGQGHLEKPFNRLLAWWSDKKAEHGMATKFLKLLATKAELPEMYDDLNSCEHPEILAEQIIEGVSEGRMPDLMIRTKNAALMLENKVYASESGDQYAPYLGYLDKWAEGRTYRALLSAREGREIPSKWHGFIMHCELADLFDKLWEDDNAPIWGRISAKITSCAFRDGFNGHERILEARSLLELLGEDTGCKMIPPGLLNTVTRAISSLPEPVIMKVQ